MSLPPNRSINGPTGRTFMRPLYAVLVDTLTRRLRPCTRKEESWLR